MHAPARPPAGAALAVFCYGEHAANCILDHRRGSAAGRLLDRLAGTSGCCCFVGCCGAAKPTLGGARVRVARCGRGWRQGVSGQKAAGPAHPLHLHLLPPVCCLEATERSLKRVLGLSKGDALKQKWRAGAHMLCTCRAPEPSDVIWEHTSVTGEEEPPRPRRLLERLWLRCTLGMLSPSCGGLRFSV